MDTRTNWKHDYVLWAEVFVLVNLGFLSVDIYLAHSENAFRYRPEWIPFFFSAIAPVILLVGLLCRQSWNNLRFWNSLGFLVGITAVLVGITGVVYHLDSTFFYERTIRSLTYAAPFVAALSYTGLGLLLILNRMVPGESREWAQIRNLTPRILVINLTHRPNASLVSLAFRHALGSFAGTLKKMDPPWPRSHRNAKRLRQCGGLSR